MSKPTRQFLRNVAVLVAAAIMIALVWWLWAKLVLIAAWLWTTLVLTSYATPGWLLAVLLLLSLAMTVRFLIGLRGAPRSTYATYVQDTFYGAVWRWSWRLNSISDIRPFCPHCDTELVYDDSSCRIPLQGPPRTDFFCEPCGGRRVASILGGNHGYAISAIWRLIERNIRTGAVPSSPPTS